MDNGYHILLETVDLKKSFGGLTAVSKVNVGVKQGELRAIIGPNGSGKTTFINLVTGVIPVTGGSVVFEGREISKAGSHHIAAMGISRTFQQGLVFNHMTVLDNVKVGRHLRMHENLWDGIMRVPRFHQEEKSARDFAMYQLERVGLADRAQELAKSLTYVQQRLLELARALATEPKLLFLDEPTGSMNVEESSKLVHLILRLQDQGMTMVVVEHNMRVVMEIAQLITVLNYGEKIAEGSPAEIQSNEKVIEAYLGKQSTC